MMPGEGLQPPPLAAACVRHGPSSVHLWDQCVCESLYRYGAMLSSITRGDRSGTAKDPRGWKMVTRWLGCWLIKVKSQEGGQRGQEEREHSCGHVPLCLPAFSKRRIQATAPDGLGSNLASFFNRLMWLCPAAYVSQCPPPHTHTHTYRRWVTDTVLLPKVSGITSVNHQVHSDPGH